MHIPSRVAAAFVVCCIPFSLAAAPPTPGRWALVASGRPVLLLELNENAAGKPGWTGSFVRPKHFEADGSFSTFSNVKGPAMIMPILSATAHPDELELTVRDSPQPLHLIWKPSEHGGTLRFKDFSFAPVPFVAVRADQHVPDVWVKNRVYSAIPDWPDNSEMTAMFDADQADRTDWPNIDANAVATRDAERREKTKAMLDTGKLRSGTDFYHAAFIFQHGLTTNDYLFAHTLAVVAAARGRSDAAWIAAATLDRYLQTIGQKQIYGTQFLTPRNQLVTQDPYDRALVSDALREMLGVPPLADQETRLQEQQRQMDKLNKSGATADQH